jgi:hypothetical protein
MMHCIDDFPRVIKLMTLGNKVSSSIAVCDARIMTVCFHNNQCQSRFMTRNGLFASLVVVFLVL